MNQNPPKQNPPKHSHRPRSGRPGVRHFLLLLLTAGVVLGVSLTAIVWWQERPIREAAAYLDQGDPDQAMSTINAFLRTNPLHGGAMSLRARTLVALGQPRQAIELFERVGSTGPQEMHAWAQALLQLERWREALPVLEHLKKIGVDRVDVLHELAACRAKVGDVDGAIEAATEFAKQPDCGARGNLLLGTLHNERGNLRQASAAWGDVLKLAPDAEGLQIPAAEFFLEYGSMLQVTGESKLATELIKRSLSQQKQPRAFVVLGDAHAHLGDQDAAEKAYRDALEMDADSRPARVGLAQLALARADAAAAKEWLSTLQSPPKLNSQVAFLLQQATTRLGDVEAAKQWREKADELRRTEQARETALQVLRDTPESNWAQVLRAYKYAEAANWAEAELILDPIVKSATDQPFIQDLYKAVKGRTKLPSLEQLPMIRH